MAFVFFPNDPRERIRQYRTYKPKADSWLAPEHVKFAQGMRRNKNPDNGPIGHLVVDTRPNILIPKKYPNQLFITSNEICY